jgi:MtN3 and saliva related transmembrane protein
MVLPSWFPEALGGVAAVCTTIAFAPQLIRVWRLRRADEISLATFALFSFGTVFWIAYGVLIASLPVILANVGILGLALAILGLKLKWDHGAPPPAG